MTAPRRPPSFFDSMTGSDTPYPEALREPGFLLDDLAGDIGVWPDWLLDDDSLRRIRLTLVEHVQEQKVVVGFAIAALQGTITAMPDASGYLRVVVEAGGTEYFAGYVERIWEEYEIWPPGATADASTESPGRMGKHRSWVSVSSKGWPALAAFANEAGWLNLMQVQAEPAGDGDA